MIGGAAVIMLVPMLMSGVASVAVSLRLAMFRKARDRIECKCRGRCDNAKGVQGDESHRYPIARSLGNTTQHCNTLA